MAKLSTRAQDEMHPKEKSGKRAIGLGKSCVFPLPSKKVLCSSLSFTLPMKCGNELDQQHRPTVGELQILCNEGGVSVCVFCGGNE